MNKFFRHIFIASLMVFCQSSHGALVTVNFSGYLDYMSNSLTEIGGTTFTTNDSLTGSFTYETEATFVSQDFLSNWELNWFDTYFAMDLEVSGANGTTHLAMEDANTRTLVQRDMNSTQQGHLRFRPYYSGQDNSVSLGDWVLSFNEQWFRTNPLDHTAPGPSSIPLADMVTNLATPLHMSLTNQISGEQESIYFRLTNYDSVTSSTGTQAVPEPTPLAMMSLILLVMVLVKRNNKAFPKLRWA